MKRISLLLFFCLCPCLIWAVTPVQNAVSMYRDVKGAKDYEISGAMMSMARPFLKYYSIGPLAPGVEQMFMLNMEKTDGKVRDDFEKTLSRIFQEYVYVGKTDTPNGVVDAYIHFRTSDLVDELVIYNPAIYSLYSLKGEFSVSDLREIGKKG